MVCNGKNGFWGEVDQVDEMVHLHNLWFGNNKQNNGWFFSEVPEG